MTEKPGVVSRLLARWLQVGNDRDELSRLDRDELAHIARDLSMSTDELLALGRKGHDASRQLHERLAALGLARADVERLARGLMRDLERSCSCCGNKAACDFDLAACPDASAWRDYCPNAEALTAVAGSKGRFPL